MPLKLVDINGWHEGLGCVPTMLCAISGEPPSQIARMLQRIAQACGNSIPNGLLPNYSPKHWIRAIMVLGGTNTVKCDWRDVHVEQRPTIDGYAEQHGRTLEIVLADYPGCDLVTPRRNRAPRTFSGFSARRSAAFRASPAFGRSAKKRRGVVVFLGVISAPSQQTGAQNRVSQPPAPDDARRRIVSRSRVDFLARLRSATMY
jgi:hypothetical protein